MLGHIGINVPDLAAAEDYYGVLMPLVGFEPFLSTDDQFAFRPAGAKPGTFLFFYPAADAGAPYSRHRVGLQHLAFMVRSRTAVRSVHELVRNLGGEVLYARQTTQRLDGHRQWAPRRSLRCGERHRIRGRRCHRPAKPALANRNWPHLVRTGQTLAGDLPADLLGPVATVKDWELVSPGH